MNDRCHVALRDAVFLTLGLLAACTWDATAAERAERADLAAGTSARASMGEADLVVRAVSGPPSAMPGMPLQIAAEVCNQGGMDAPYSSVRVVLSADDVIDAGDPDDPDDIVFGEQPVPYLAPGACARVTAPGVVPGGPEPVARYHLGAIADAHDTILEADEANNAGAGRVLAVGYEADLVIDRVRAPVTATPGGGPPGSPHHFEVEVRVCNQGQAPSPFAMVEIHVAEEGNAAPPMPLAPIYVPYLDRGDCFNGTAQPQLWQAPAVYLLGATVDPWDDVPELIEDNNTHVAGRLGVGHDADLVVTAITSPGSASPGGNPPLSVTVCNQGHALAYSIPVEIFLSEDDAFDRASDFFIGHAPVPSLEPAQCATVPALSQVYVPWLQGAFRLVAVVDGFAGVPEIFEDNNTFVGDLFGVGWDADLVVTEVTGVSGWWPYEDFGAQVRVCNRGQQQSYGSYVELYFSTDDEITTADLHAGETFVPGLAPGACTRRQARAFAPPGEGAYVLGAIVDPHDAVVELIETNNAAAGPRVGIGYGPDLVVTAVHAPALGHVGGNDTYVLVQVCNHGRGPSASAALDLHASRNDDISVDDHPVGREYVWGLQPGDCTGVAVRAMLDVPQHGRYLLGAVVDADQTVSEILEDNNVRFSAPIGVGYGSDLVVTAVTAPASIQPGAAFDVSATVCNQGFAPSDGVPLFVLASDDAHLSSWTDQHIGFSFIHSLLPGQCHTATMPGWSPPGPAPWIGAVIDSYASQQEIREDNNTLLGQRMGVGYEPDLVVAAVSAPPTVQPYQPLEVTARVCNQGQGPAGGSEIAVYVGDAGSSGPGQPPAGVGYLPWIEPGACSDVIVPAHTMDALGEQTLTARVDPHGWLPELLEDNNTAATLIGIGHEADLIVTAVSGPASAQPWALIDVTARVCNQGQWDSHNARLDVVLSPDAHVDASDLAIGAIGLPFLAQGACEDVTVSAQAILFGGVYTLGAVARQDDGPPELVTSNNGRASGLLALGWDADLVIRAVTGPASAVAGSEVAIDVEVCNQGQSPSHGSEIWVVLSRDAIVDRGDTVDAPWSPAPVPNLAPGACEVVSVPVFAYQPEGRYVAGALVDPQGWIHELVESNNTGAGTTLDIVSF